ncbi:50S ribosomal protein L15 [Rhabdochlamydiaceae symbiont of Dictyostelium giganteum]|uniref:50S ribosomal protein L15 n=1 Tax=Rhabdochlamydiaceae symbiont of Dictyostelium giganteum TaxID=3342349 RepID=UPI00384B255D
MISLSNLANTHRPRKRVQRVGRGVGSKRGKTSCRGVKGDKSRRGYKAQEGREGGQLPLYRKLPTKGFVNGRFKNNVHSMNLGRLSQLFQDGDLINLQTLRERGYAPRRAGGGLKILAQGNLDKKVTIEANAFSSGAIAKLEKAKISYKILEAKTV